MNPKGSIAYIAGLLLFFLSASLAGLVLLFVFLRDPGPQGPPGRDIAVANCARCHAFGATLTADLSRLNDGIGNLEVFRAIVLQGAFAFKGMGSFADRLSPGDAAALHAFIGGRPEPRTITFSTDLPSSGTRTLSSPSIPTTVLVSAPSEPVSVVTSVIVIFLDAQEQAQRVTQSLVDEEEDDLPKQTK